MPKSHANCHWQRALIFLAGTVVSVVVITCLYWAQSIFIPVAMAVFLTFLLSPAVSFLQRKGVGRVPAVLGVMALTVVLLGALVWLVTVQVTALAARLPEYGDNIQAKLKVVTDRVEHLNRGFSSLIVPVSPERKPAEADPEKPSAVVVKPEGPPWVARFPEMVRPAAHLLGGSALAVVLTGFMLLKREDLRNRLIRLAGRGNVTVATRALDETGHRVSRFLVMQALISAATGATIGLGLLLIGVEYALLWGFLVFALRYIPYVGIWFAALPPILLSLAMSEGWAQPLAVIALIFVVEMIAGNVLEPWLFGHSMGVSEVSLLVSAAFWAFLWGPIGMVLSSPMTVCLAVLGKYYPRLKFLDVLLGDEPALEPGLRFYQRLLARDRDEAEEIVLARFDEVPGEQVIDEMLVPALSYAKRDRDDLSEEDERFVLESTREVGEDLADRLGVPRRVPTGPISGVSEADLPRRTRLVGCAADDAADEAGLHLLACTLDPNLWDVAVLPAELRGLELLTHLAGANPEVICVAALPPASLAHSRYLCKRLRAQFPAAKILVARWGAASISEQSAQQLREAGADFVSTGFVETREQLQGWLPTPEGGPERRAASLVTV